MKSNILTVFAAALVTVVACRAGAGVIAGPIVNPSNGHEYFLLSPDTWQASEDAAEDLGGTLAVIRDAAEQKWIYSQFSSYGGTNRNLWIGLHRNRPTADPTWMTGAKFDYSNWAGDQPDNAGGVEDCVFMASVKMPWGFPAGSWGDVAGNQLVDWVLPNGVVEVAGTSHEKNLTGREKSLVGTWYESGKANRDAWIAGTDNQLFLITHDHHAARLVLTPAGYIYNQDHLHGEIVKDKILWSNGTWWSRQPAEYEGPDKLGNEATAALDSSNPAN